MGVFDMMGAARRAGLRGASTGSSCGGTLATSSEIIMQGGLLVEWEDRSSRTMRTLRLSGAAIGRLADGDAPICRTIDGLYYFDDARPSLGLYHPDQRGSSVFIPIPMHDPETGIYYQGTAGDRVKLSVTTQSWELLTAAAGSVMPPRVDPSVPPSAPPPGSGMSTAAKVAIGVGVLAVVLGIGWAITR